MSTNKTLAILAASSVLALISLSPVYAESIPKQEQNQLNNSRSRMWIRVRPRAPTLRS